MKRLISTPAWKGYCKKAGCKDMTELLSYEDHLVNTTQVSHDVSVDGEVMLDSVSFTFEEDASVPSIKQKLIALQEIPELIIEDVKGDKDKTVLRRLTMKVVKIIDIDVVVGNGAANGKGHATVTVRCSWAKWERLTPDGSYTEAVWDPHDLGEAA